MLCSRETKYLNIVCIALVLLAGISRLMERWGLVSSFNLFIFVTFTVALLIWICQLQRRFIGVHVRRYLTAAAWLMIFWITVRTIKYEFLVREHFLNRYAWYLYYIAFIFVPLLMFFSVLYIGRPYDQPISRKWKLFYLPAFLLLGFVLTNDIHQLAFYFPLGVEKWREADYVHGPVYFLVVLWMAALLIALLVIAFVRCRVPGKLSKIWVPVLPILVGGFYTVCLVMDKNVFLSEMYQVPEIGCFTFAMFMESLIVLRFFPSNDSYGELWSASTIGAGIMDEDGVIRLKSVHARQVSRDEVEQALHEIVLFDGGDTVLRSHRISGGFGYWTKDNRQINRLNRKLADTMDVLAEENAMLAAENKMEAERAGIRQQSELYDSIARYVSPQLDRMEVLLQQASGTEEHFEQTMKYACILNCYVKRSTNLLLLSHQKDSVSMGELCIAIGESLEYINLFGIKSSGTYVGEELLPGKYLLCVYEMFETVCETVIPGADALLVHLELLHGVISLRMESNMPMTQVPAQADLRQKLPKALQSRGLAGQGKISVEIEQTTVYVSCSLAVGGEWYDSI